MRAAMARNGSPPPRFSTDEGRTYFLVELPVHPELPGVGQAHDEAHDQAHDEAHDGLTETQARVLAFVQDRPRSRVDIAEHLGLNSRSGHLLKALDRLRELALVELTIPDKPRSKAQKPRITEAGRAWLLRRKGKPPKEKL